jgi:hypothetical protein
MKRRNPNVCILAAFAFCFLPTVALAQSGTSGYGIQWVQSHPFTTFAFPYGAGNNIPLQKGANFSNYFADSVNGGYYQTPWVAYSYINDTHATLQDRLSEPYITVNYIADEPTDAQLPQIAANTAYARTVNSTAPVLVNSGISWTGSNQAQLSQYLDNLFDQVNPDILSFDRYPWLIGHSSYDPAYFGYLMAIRAASLQHNVPFFDWIQSAGETDNGGMRMPSESELRMNVFSSLTAGSKGLGYWTFGVSPSVGTGSLLNADGTPGPLYSVAGDINKQVSNLGQSLRALTSTAVGFLPGAAASVRPQGMSDWTAGMGGDPHLVEVDVNGGIAGIDGMLGLFTDSGGQHYFMLTNLYSGENLTSGQSANTFVLTFDTSITSLLQLNAVTGQTDLLALAPNHTLTLTLPGGQGALFKYNTGPFAGVPEPGTLAMLAFGGGILLLKRRRRMDQKSSDLSARIG